MKTHKQKLKLARRMMSNEEIKKKVSPFQSKWWNKRRQDRWVKEAMRNKRASGVK